MVFLTVNECQKSRYFTIILFLTTQILMAFPLFLNIYSLGVLHSPPFCASHCCLIEQKAIKWIGKSQWCSGKSPLNRFMFSCCHLEYKYLNYIYAPKQPDLYFLPLTHHLACLNMAFKYVQIKSTVHFIYRDVSEYR